LKFPRVSIVILNWNGWKDTIECLESLYRITYPNYDVIVVDNGSKDESIQKIKEYAAGKIQVNSKFFEYNPYNKPINVFVISEDDVRAGKFNKPLYEKIDVDRRMILIRNKDNYGFAGGNNVGIKFALSVLNSDYILLLNNDTVVDRRFLDKLVEAAESDEKIGIVGPKIYYYEYNGRTDVIWFAGGKLNLLFYPGYYHVGNKLIDRKEIFKVNKRSTTDSDWITGAAMLIKIIEPFTLDHIFFFGCEDLELSLRYANRGYTHVVVLSSYIWHKVGQSRKIKYNALLLKSIEEMKTNFRFILRYLEIPTYLKTLLISWYAIQVFVSIIKRSIFR